MSRERIAIDAWASWISPEGATKWPDEYLHIFRKYRSPQVIFDGMSVEEMLADMDTAGVFGLSASTVPLPTMIASHVARRMCASAIDTRPEICAGLRPASPVLPSADIAIFRTMCGRPSRTRRKCPA